MLIDSDDPPSSHNPTGGQFAAELIRRARERAVIEITDPTGARLAVMPLWQVEPVDPEAQGFASGTTIAPGSVLCVTYRRDDHALEVVPPAWARWNALGADGIPAPDPAPERPIVKGLLIAEALAVAARLRADVCIDYAKPSGDVERREIGGVRVVDGGDLVRAVDRRKHEPRAWKFARIVAAHAALLHWSKAAGWSSVIGGGGDAP